VKGLFNRAVRHDAEGARASRPRPRVPRRREGGVAGRHPPGLRAVLGAAGAVRAHERTRRFPFIIKRHRRRRRPPRVHVVLPVRRLRQVPAAQGRGAGVRRGGGSATGSSAWTRSTPHRSARTCPSARSRAPTSSASAGSPPTPTSARSPASSPLVGEDRFFWASDFPHPDHAPRYLGELEELVSMLPASARWKLMSDNVPRGLRAASALDHDPAPERDVILDLQRRNPWARGSTTQRLRWSARRRRRRK